MVVPEGWEVKLLGDIGYFSKGQGINRDNMHSGAIPCIRYGEIYTHHNNYIKKFYSHISIEVSKDSRKLRTGELLFAASGETKEDIGKCVAFIDNCEAYAGSDIIIFTPETDINSLFLGYYLNSEYVKHQKSSKGQGDAIVHILAHSLAEIMILLPPLPEQLRIAEVLSDTDLYITTLERLIAKKEAVKQGVMQELLTGKRRLPGFKGEWVEKRLGEIGYTYSGLSGKQKHDFGVGNAQYITFLNVLSNTVIDTSILERVTISTSEKQNVVQCGDIFFNTSSETPEEVGIGSVYLGNQEVYLNSFCFGIHITNIQKVFSSYLSYYISTTQFRKFIYPFAQGSTRFNLCKADFEKSKFKLPSLENQKRIYESLKCLSGKVAAEDAILKQYHSQKQYLLRQMFI